MNDLYFSSSSLVPAVPPDCLGSFTVLYCGTILIPGSMSPILLCNTLRWLVVFFSAVVALLSPVTERRRELTSFQFCFFHIDHRCCSRVK